MGPRLRGDDRRELLAALQLDRSALLQLHHDVIVVDLVQRIADAAIADLPGGELVDHAITRRSCLRHRLVAVGRHATFAVLPLIAVEGDDALAGAVDRTFVRARALAPLAGNRIA